MVVVSNGRSLILCAFNTLVDRGNLHGLLLWLGISTFCKKGMFFSLKLFFRIKNGNCPGVC